MAATGAAERLLAAVQGGGGIAASSLVCVCAALLNMLAVFAPAPAAADSAGITPVEVRDIRLGAHEERTRFVLELSGPAAPTVFTLPNEFNPYYRVVIDLPQVVWNSGQSAELPGMGLVKHVRYALNKPGQSRMVLDLPNPARVAEADILPPRDGHGYRFVLDLEPAGRDAFLRTAGWPSAQRIAPAAALARPAAPGPRKFVVVLDPGHGGKDPGAIGVTGTYEKDVALKAAKAIRKSLEATGLFTVHLTRDDDRFIRLQRRVEIARAKNADLFISIHADSIGKPKVRGASVYTLSETASDKEAARLARKENAVDEIDGAAVEDEVLQILIDLAQRDTMNNSANFAQTLLPEFEARSINLLRNTHRFAGFRVLTAPDVPSVLLELGYLSNAEDEKLLKSAEWRAKMAAAVTSGVEQYFNRQTAMLRAN